MPDLPTAVMMFAAGFGTRMGALVVDRPKPMIEVAGRPLIDHTLALAQAITPQRVVANLHYKPEPLQAHLEPLGVTCTLETPQILETGGGLRHARPLLGAVPVFTTNTDAIWRGPNPFALLRDAWDPDRMEALLACIPTESAIGHKGSGDFDLDTDGRLQRGTALVYGGIQIIKTDRLQAIPQEAFSLNLVWDQMLADGGLFGLRYPGRWCDVGHPGGIDLAEALLGAPDV